MINKEVTKQLNEFISAKVVYYRRLKGLTQQDIANATGLTRTAVNNIENGHAHVNITFLYILCNILDTSIDKFIPENNIIEVEYETVKVAKGISIKKG